MDLELEDLPSEFADGGWSSSELANVDFGPFLGEASVSVVGAVGVECRGLGDVVVWLLDAGDALIGVGVAVGDG